MVETLHETHPGFDARGCQHQYNVSRCAQNGRGGYGCSLTGGHCLPSPECATKEQPLSDVEIECSRQWCDDPYCPYVHG